MPVPVDLGKLSDLVKNVVIKKDIYNKLVAKVTNIDTSGFVLKTKYDTDKSDASVLVKKAYYNTKITEIEVKIPDISNLATKKALTTVENKIRNVSNLKQIMTQKLLILKINLIIIIMRNILIIQSLIN